MHLPTRPLVLAALFVILAISATVAHADSSTFRFRFAVSPWNSAFSLGAGDVDGDGIPDVIVPSGNDAQVYSGASGRVLFTLTPPDPSGLGLLVSSYAVGDIEGDGQNRIVVGAPGACESGRVYVFSGSTGQLQFSLRSPSSLDTCNAVAGAAFGESVALVRAAHGRGLDVVVGAPADASGGGSVYVFSGRSHALLRTLTAPNPTEDASFGYNIRAADGERGAVLAIASFGGVDPTMPSGRVYVFSTRATPDYVIDNPDPVHFHLFGLLGLALRSDRRSKPLVAIGGINSEDPNAFRGKAFIYSGATLLYELTTPNPQPTSLFGVSIAFTDLNGGSSLLVGAPGETVSGNALSGRVYVFNARGLLTGSLTSPSPRANEAFGVPIIVSRASCETALVVGAPSVDFSSGHADYFGLPRYTFGDRRCGSR